MSYDEQEPRIALKVMGYALAALAFALLCFALSLAGEG